MIKFACPYCYRELFKEYHIECDFYVIKHISGILELHRSGSSWEECLEQNRASARAAKDYRSKLSPEAVVEVPSHVSIDIMETSLTFLRPVEGKVVLDLGGSNGWAVKRLLKEGAAEGYVIDINADNLPLPEENLTCVVGNGYHLPFVSNQFDIVFESATLHHFEDVPAVLRQIRRVLKPGGIYLSQGNPPRSEQASEDTDRIMYMEKFGLIETMPKRSEYTKYFEEVFGSVTFVPVGYNMIMYALKEQA